VKGAILF